MTVSSFLTGTKKETEKKVAKFKVRSRKLINKSLDDERASTQTLVLFLLLHNYLHILVF